MGPASSLVCSVWNGALEVRPKTFLGVETLHLFWVATTGSQSLRQGSWVVNAPVWEGIEH